jgi:YHS domain-containing protein
MRAFLAYATAGALLFGAGAAHAATQGEFHNQCVMSLALGKDYQTDCSVSADYQGKTYCFGNETAREVFFKKPDEFLAKARAYWASKHAADQQ